MAKQSSPEKYKKIGLIVLGGLFVVVVVYNFFLSGPPTRPVSTNDNKPAKVEEHHSAGAVVSPPGRTQAAPLSNPGSAEARLQSLLSDMTPLDLDSIKRIKEGTETKRGNIFAFYIPPPPPPKVIPTPVPPPIALRFMQPINAIAGTPRSFELKVSGAQLPPDAQIMFNGSPKQTKRVDDSTLTAEIAPSDYANSGAVQVQIRSASKPQELYSNTIQFSVQAAPQPPFRMVGIIGDLAVLELNTGRNKEYLRLRRGETFQGVWRIDSVNDHGVEVTDTRYDIKNMVPLEAKGRI